MFKLLKKAISEKKVQQYAEEYISNDMIKSIASQMCKEYVAHIENRVEETDKNVFEIHFSYAVSSEGVIFSWYGDLDYDVAYKDFGYSVIEDDEKRQGIAIALMSIIVPNVRKKFANITTMDTNIMSRNDTSWLVIGELKLKMDMGNKLKSL
jgi:hypothetical protein